MKIIRTLILLVAAAVPVMACAAKFNQLPVDPEVRIGVLSNGLTYYIRHNDTPANRADFFLAYRVGSVNEEEHQRGLAHFLEHMCFNGTKHFPGNSLISYLESIGVKFGANLNAYTSTDETVYNICDVPTDRSSCIDSCLLILRDWSHDLTLSDEDIDAERGVIKGEWRQRNGAAANRLLEKAAPVVYGGSLYGNRLPIGLMEVVETFPHEALRQYYRRWYHPDNQCVIVVGDVDADAVEATIQSLWADVARPDFDVIPPKVEVPANKEIIAAVQTDSEQVVPVVQVFVKHDLLPDSAVNTILELRRDMAKELVTSMLAERLTDLENATGTLMCHVGIGDRQFLLSRTCEALMVRASTSPGREADCVNAIAAELQRAAVHGFTPTELQRAKLDCKSALDAEFAAVERTTNTQYARRYVRHYLDGGALPSAVQYYKMMKGVLGQIDVAYVNRYLQSVVKPDCSNVVLMAYLPGSDVPSLTPQSLSNAYSSVCLDSLEPYVEPEIASQLIACEPQSGKIVSEETDTLFDTTVWTLSNGIRVHLKPTGFAPGQVIIAGYSPGGFSQNYDPALAPEYRLTNDVLAVTGFGGHTSTGLRRIVAGKKVRVDLTVDNMEERISASTSKSDMPLAFRLLWLKATSPQRDDNAFRSLIENKRLSLTSQTSNLTFTMADSIHYYVYGKHPLGAKLKASDLDAVSYDRILALHRERFGDMSDFDFYIVGDFEADTLRSLVERYVASLPGAGRSEKPRDIGYRYAQGREHLRFTTPMQTPQTIAYTFFNYPCDYELANVVKGHIVGSLLQSALLKDLRENRGWTYGVKAHGGISAGMNGHDRASYMMSVYIRVAPENADSCFEIVVSTARGLASAANIPREELDKVKKYMLKSYGQNLESNSYWLTVMHMHDKFGKDMHSAYRDIVESITPDDIASFANRYLAPANCMQLEMSPAD